MSIVNAKEIMVEAAKGKYAIGAFNITDLTQIEGVVDAAVEKRSPVIIQTSVEPSIFLGTDVMVAIYRTIASAAPVPICLNLDHCTEIEYCKKCADAGYPSIMIDASMQPYTANVSQTREVADYCHKAGSISVEAELGMLGGAADQITGGEQEAQIADLRQAVEFVEATGLDIFAPAFGMVHGVYETRNPTIDFERLAEINQLLNGTANGIRTPLAVNGGSGLPEKQIRRLIEAGGVKFNVSADMKRTLIDARYEYMSANRAEYEPGKVDVAARDAIRKAVGHWIHVLGSSGKA